MVASEDVCSFCIARKDDIGLLAYHTENICQQERNETD